MNFKQIRKENLKFLISDAVIVAAVPFVTIHALFSAGELSLFLIYINSWVVTITVSTLIIFYLFGIYGRVWSEENWRAFLSIVAAVTVSVALAFFILEILRTTLPKIIFFTQWILEVILISAGRILYKLKFGNKGISQKIKRVAIVGAGSSGAMLLREIREHAPNMEVVCFVDDDAEKIGSKLNGVPIYGDTVAINRIARNFNLHEIIIALPSVDGKTLRRITEHCRKTDCVIKNVPSIIDFVNNRVSLNEVRKISLEDLLRREPIQMDVEKITEYIVGKIVLITGAGGSIGSELCRQISKVGAHTILLLGRGENSIYEIHRELIEKYPNQNYQALIANVTDAERMREIFETYRPDVVFHAAAHKHVPLMEAQPDEAVRNNIFGTKNVADLADEFECDMFLLVSTDKAVNPTSVMGATKRVAELVLQNIQRHSKTRFVCTRFGNVLGSRGSVVPLFKKQIANGGPVTVTHPEMIRYFMTIPEAVQLVLQAGSQAEGGEVFLFDMGNPVKIKDMAEDLIKLHGLEPGKDIEIVYTGMRPGEKLYEELLTAEEGTKSTKCKYAVALASGTSAIHLAVKLAGVKAGDKVFCSDLTFSATVNPVVYEKGVPIFIDSERETWNLDPATLERAFKLFPDVKVVVVANLYGTPAKFDEIKKICEKNSAILIEDAAESLGATYNGQQTGTFGHFNAISFNGNKIITTSGGGMLLTDDENAAKLARKWSTQSREPAPWYQHIDVGYNYRMGNIVAGIGRGQLLHLDEHIAAKKKIYERYRDGLKDLPVKMNPYDEKIMHPNFWLSCLLIDEAAMCRQVRDSKQALFVPERGKTCPTEILETLIKFNAEGRPIWKPMHLQPIYCNNEFICEGEDVGADIFNRGLCLPSDIKMTAAQQDTIIEIIRSCFR